MLAADTAAMRTMLAVFAAIAAGCSSPQPAPASAASSEIAALEKQLSSTSAQARSVTPAPTAPAAPTASPAFRTRVEEALQFVTNELPRGGAARDQKQFDADIAAARRLMGQVREIARTPAEQNAALLLTAIFIKDRERHQTILSVRGNHADADIRELAAASAACRSELDDWMKAARGEMPILEVGACLQESEGALAFLTPAGGD